jgi:anti-anti-sigma factor
MVDRRAGIAVVYTEGYLNNESGEALVVTASNLLVEGYRALLCNLENTKIVDEVGISILLDMIGKVGQVNGRLGFCCLTPTIEKTFGIMGLTQAAAIYPDEQTAVAALAA